ncbi:MAG: CRISPR-associated protein Cas4 [Planctomycetes bacterium]|nr:CRISPR-associated protein Cas4 [Planctomycetota bacterium]
MFDEDDLLPLSALQHLLFCERQCALIHLEQAWDENRLTAEGRVLHERVHEQGDETRGDVHVARGVPLRSLRLGLAAKADVVEYHRIEEAVTSPDSEHPAPPGVRLPDLPGLWRPFPVEYKRGRPKPDHCDLVQLCAQALCLEEMHGVAVPRGALFYGATRRRLEVEFDVALRRETQDAARRLHALVAAQQTPKPQFGPKCERCSLADLCLPHAGSGRSAARYLRATLDQLGRNEA